MEKNKMKMKLKMIKDYALLSNDRCDIYSLVDMNLQNPDFDLVEALRILFNEASLVSSGKRNLSKEEIKIKSEYLNALYSEYLKELKENSNYVNKTRKIKN